MKLPPDTVLQCHNNFPFTWAKDSITYLGIKIPKSLSNLFQINFAPALKETREENKALERSQCLMVWQSLPSQNDHPSSIYYKPSPYIFHPPSLLPPDKPVPLSCGETNHQESNLTTSPSQKIKEE